MLAVEKFSYTTNPPIGLDESVVGEWCKWVKFEINRYYETKYKDETLCCINKYVAQTFQLQKEKYQLQKRVSELEKENILLSKISKAYEHTLNTQISSMDDSDTINKREKIFKELLLTYICHIKDPSVSKDLAQAAEET